MVNVGLACFLLLFLVPIVRHLPDRPLSVQVILVLLGIPLLLLVSACLSSAARPGSLGRLARRARRR